MSKGLGYGIYYFCRNTLGWDVYDFFDVIIHLIGIVIVLVIVVSVLGKAIDYFWGGSKETNADDTQHKVDTSPKTGQISDSKDIQRIFLEARAKAKIDQESTLGKDVVNSVETETIPNTERNFCSNCGAKIEQDEKFCHSCGVKLNSIM